MRWLNFYGVIQMNFVINLIQTGEYFSVQFYYKWNTFYDTFIAQMFTILGTELIMYEQA